MSPLAPDFAVAAVEAPEAGALPGGELGDCAYAPLMRNANVSAATIVFIRFFLGMEWRPEFIR
jgi:hypothetical protein